VTIHFVPVERVLSCNWQSTAHWVGNLVQPAVCNNIPMALFVWAYFHMLPLVAFSVVECEAIHVFGGAAPRYTKSPAGMTRIAGRATTSQVSDFMIVAAPDPRSPAADSHA